MLYRLSAHERLVDIAHAHGTSTDAICAANPHKRAVELPGVGAVFEDMRAGEEIAVPGVGDMNTDAALSFSSHGVASISPPGPGWHPVVAPGFSVTISFGSGAYVAMVEGSLLTPYIYRGYFSQGGQCTFQGPGSLPEQFFKAVPGLPCAPEKIYLKQGLSFTSNPALFGSPDLQKFGNFNLYVVELPHELWQLKYVPKMGGPTGVCPPGLHMFAGKCVKNVGGFGLPGAGGKGSFRG